MANQNQLICPKCAGNHFLIKYEASYVYSYVIDSNAPGLRNNSEFLPFMFDNREQKETKQYIECHQCGLKFPCYFNHWDENISIKALQNAISTARTDLDEADLKRFTVQR